MPIICVQAVAARHMDIIKEKQEQPKTDFNIL